MRTSPLTVVPFASASTFSFWSTSGGKKTLIRSELAFGRGDTISTSFVWIISPFYHHVKKKIHSKTLNACGSKKKNNFLLSIAISCGIVYVELGGDGSVWAFHTRNVGSGD